MYRVARKAAGSRRPHFLVLLKGIMPCGLTLDI
jgi:hypothetical protein